MVCTFFGHREVQNSGEIKEKLNITIRRLIENDGVTTFYVGNNGSFDRLVLETLREVSKEYKINYTVVLAYIDFNKEDYDYESRETLYPENLDKTPLRFAIDKRNRFMIEKSDIAVSYINRSIGGAAKQVELCEKKGLRIIKLGKL